MSYRFFQTAIDRLVSARERQVRRYVNATLLTLDDKQLADLGRNRDEIRREGSQPYYF